MKVVVIAPKAYSFRQFRGELLLAMKANGHSVIAIAPDKDGQNDAEEFGASYKYVPFRRESTNPLSDLLLIVRLRKAIKEEKPDAVFSYAAKPVIYGSIAAHFAGIKNVYAMLAGLGTIYSIDKNSLKSKILKVITNLLYTLAFKFCNKVIFQNKDDLNELVRYGLLEKEKCNLVSGSGVNMDKYKVVKLPLEPIFIMVSRILREKGVMEYCQAARIVKKDCQAARMQLLGPFDNGPEAIKYDHLKPFIDDGSLEYLGETTNVIPFIEQSAIFVLPSIYREGIPHSILEAMSMGRPIITTDGPGCRETVKRGMNGFLVPPHDPLALADAMIKLANDDNTRRQMGEASLQYCKERFNVSLVNRDMLRIMGL